jgi:branched-subunit amino acid ABC-type transport system permease component
VNGGAFPRFLFAGIAVGAVNAPVALSLSITDGASDVLSYAPSELIMIGGEQVKPADPGL